MSETTSKSSVTTEGAEPGEPSRRAFIRDGGIASALGFFGLNTDGLSAQSTAEGTRRSLPVLRSLPKGSNPDILIRMQREVIETMAKPIEQRRWKMVIDTRKCVGCHACTVACVAENKLPPGVIYRPVKEKTTGTYPNLKTMFLPQPCMQCDAPPCVPVCPADATWKRKDGIVAIDYDKCIGCGFCVEACPYQHRRLDAGKFYTEETPKLQPYEQKPNFEYGKSWNRTGEQPPVSKARKCHFCVHRLEEGELPQCVTTCIGRATFFGDANNPDHLVNQVAKNGKIMLLLEEKGTKPQVEYVV